MTIVERYRSQDGSEHVEIIVDPAPPSPRGEDGDIVSTFLAPRHERYQVGDETYEPPALECRVLEEWSQGAEIFEVAIRYGPSGETKLAIDDENPGERLQRDEARWKEIETGEEGIEEALTDEAHERQEAGPRGYLVVTRKRLATEGWDRSQARRYLAGEMAEYEAWLNGQVHGFRRYRTSMCNLGHRHRNEIDTCYGFYGNDHARSGLLMQAGVETGQGAWLREDRT